MPEKKPKRIYRHAGEIRSALLRSDFNLAVCAQLLGMTLKALHERLQRTHNAVFMELQIAFRNSKPSFTDKIIEQLLTIGLNTDVELYRKIRRELKDKNAGSRREQIEKAIARACKIPREDAYRKLFGIWDRHILTQLVRLDICRREQKRWEATRRQRRRLRRHREAAPGGTMVKNSGH